MSVARLELAGVAIGDPYAIASAMHFALAPGEIVALIGPSGCGKSTLLKTVLGAQPALAGRIWVNGVDVTGLPIHLRSIAAMFQEPLLFPHLSVRENIAYALRRQKAVDTEQRVDSLLELIGLGRTGSGVAELSGGQQQRVALARAVAGRPAVVLLDEPLSAVDEATKQPLVGQLREILREADSSSLYVTHNQAEAEAVADRIVRFTDLAGA